MSGVYVRYGWVWGGVEGDGVGCVGFDDAIFVFGVILIVSRILSAIFFRKIAKSVLYAWNDTRKLMYQTSRLWFLW